MSADSTKDSTAAAFNPFFDLTKTFEQFTMPGADMSAFMDARRKDVEALVAANKITYEALQALANTQSDMLTQTMQGMQESAMAAMASGSGSGGGAKGVDMMKHAEAAQKAWQKMLTDMKELAETVQKAQVEAMAGLTDRAKENMGTIKGPTHAK